MSADWRVELTIGPYSWSINRGDPPAFPAGVDVLDLLRVGWQMPETDLWPPQPEPTTLSLSLLAPAAADLAELDTNTPVTLLIFAGVVDPLDTPIPSVRFVGRVAELAGFPRLAGGQQGWQLDLQCVDLVADLADENIGGFSVDPLETAGPYGWIWGYFHYCDLEPPDWTTGTNTHSQLANPLVKMQAETLLSATDKLLARYADAGEAFGDSSVPENHAHYLSTGWRRGIILPNITYDNEWDTDVPYVIDWVSRRSATSPFSPNEGGRLSRDPDTGVWFVELVPPPATTWDPFFGEETPVYDFAVVIDAAYLDYGVRWSRSKFLDPNRVILTAISGSDWNVPDDWKKLVRSTPKPAPVFAQRVTAQLGDVRVIDPDDARHVGDMYVSDAYDNPGGRYQSESFTWYASRDPQWPIFRGLFPDNQYTSLFRGFSAPITITGIPPEQSPNGARWFTGTPKGTDWTFERGEFRIGLTLYPRIPRPTREPTEETAVTAFSWIGLAELDDAPTWSDLSPADTWLDYRLVRPLGADYPTGP